MFTTVGGRLAVCWRVYILSKLSIHKVVIPASYRSISGIVTLHKFFYVLPHYAAGVPPCRLLQVCDVDCGWWWVLILWLMPVADGGASCAASR